MTEEALSNNKADAVMFGRWFISNPDLPERIAKQAELTKYDRSTFLWRPRKRIYGLPFPRLTSNFFS